MKVIREISKKTKFEEIEQIYKSGHKIAIKFGEDTILAFSSCIQDNEGDMSLDEVKDVKVKDCFILENGELSARCGELVVVEEVMRDKLGYLAFSVVAEDGGKRFEAGYHLTDLNSGEYAIAGESVYEVE